MLRVREPPLATRLGRPTAPHLGPAVRLECRPTVDETRLQHDT